MPPHFQNWVLSRTLKLMIYLLKERAAHKKVNVRVHGKLTSLSGQLLALWQYIRDQMYCPVDILPPPLQSVLLVPCTL